MKIILLVLGVIFCAISCSSGAVEEAAYPSFTLFTEFVDVLNRSIKANPSVEDDTMNCQFSTTKGRRRYQEDRIFCDLDNVIYFLGMYGPKLKKVGVVAVFDGHIGEEASDMASKIFMSEFRQNTYHVNHDISGIGYYPLSWGSDPLESSVRHARDIQEQKLYMEILKEALPITIKNVDAEITRAAIKKNLYSGTTAVIAVLVDDRILVANVGDSKALLCSKKAESSKHLSPIELTRDHNALIDEERARIEEAGGFIVNWTVPLVMGHFPMTRAIGDVPLKRYGIIAEPEMTGWQSLTEKDRYLVVASDGIFESLSPKDVCNLLNGEGYDKRLIKNFPSQTPPSTAADLIVQTAFVKGSSDNLSVVVVPLFTRESMQDESM